MTEAKRQAANVEERNRLGMSLCAVYDEACCLPERDLDYVWARLERRGTTRSYEEVEAIFRAYAEAPHCHSVLTLHTFGRPCELGEEHPGCCPGTKGCDRPGWYPA